MAENRRSLGMANALYAQGRVNYLDVLDAERSLYQSEDELAVSDQAVSLDLIVLYKALGGGWETLTPESARSLQPPRRRDDARVLSGVALGRRQQILSPRDRRIGAGARQYFFLGRQGGLAALVGPDGAGKTTLLRLLAGLMKADGGTVTVLGIDAAKDPQAIQSRISYMPQQFGLYEDLTVRENLDLYADLHGVTADEQADAIRPPDGDDRP